MAKKNIFTALAKVTNIDKSRFGKLNENSVFIPVSTLIAKATKDKALTLYSFDVVTCRLKEVQTDLNVPHINPVQFVREFVNYWYYLQRETFERAYTDRFPVPTSEELEEMTEDEHIKYDVIRARYDDAMAVLKKYNKKAVATVSPTVSDLVKGVARADAELYSAIVLEKFNPVKLELDRLAKIDYANAATVAPNLSELRNRLSEFTKAFWRESDACTAYVYNCNASLANAVYKYHYDGLSLDKGGKVVSTSRKDGDLLHEIMLAILLDLQRKAAKEPEAKKPTGKKNNGKKPEASKPEAKEPEAKEPETPATNEPEA